MVEERPRLLYSGARECDGEFGDFGFLSDTKLLNTALTRARCLVAVVGDPVALCAIGECANVWRTYMKHCQNLGSISPSYVTLDKIRSQVRDLMSSSYAANVQMISKISQDTASGNYEVTPEIEAAGNNDDELDFGEVKAELDILEAQSFNEQWNTDFQVEPDLILTQLAKEAQKAAAREEEKAKARAGVSYKSSSVRSGDPLKLSCIRLHSGHAVLDYSIDQNERKKRSGTSGVGKRRLLRDSDANDYNSDSETTDADDDNEAPSAAEVEYTPQQLKDLMQRQPERYKHATLVIENSSNMYAKCIDDESLKKIKLGSRQRCGRAFNNDEVVVELLAIDPEDVCAIPEDERRIVNGQVIGILRRSINPKYRTFVCTVENDNTGLMVPINRSIPKIYNLETRDQMRKSRKGHVCVYSFTRSREPVFDHYEPVDWADPTSKLFVVRYLKWDAKCYAPLGIVVGIMPKGTNPEQAMNIYNIEYCVPEKFRASTVEEVNRLYPEG
jgi:hypothetical protein